MKRATIIGVVVAVVVIAALLSIVLVQPRILGIGEAPQPTKLVIWWNKGYYAEEDLALMEAAQEFGKMKGVFVEVSFFTTEDIPKKLIAALEARSPPDVAYAHFEDWMLSPKWAWDGLLEDVSDIINENKQRYIPEALQTAYLYNNKEGKYSYYKVPIQMQTIHIHYWKDLVAEAGFDPSPQKIPKTWDEFWNFWFTVQDKLRAKDPEKYRNVYAIGWTLGTGSTDAFYNLYRRRGTSSGTSGSRCRTNLGRKTPRSIGTCSLLAGLSEQGQQTPSTTSRPSITTMRRSQSSLQTESST